MTRRLSFLAAGWMIIASVACGGSVSSESPSDSGTPSADSVALDSGVDSHVTSDTFVDETPDTPDAKPPPIDAPPGTALVRIANMLWGTTPANIRVCLDDELAGTSTLIEPPGVTGGLPFQSVTTYVVAPTGSNFVVHIVGAGDDCTAPAIFPAGSPLDVPIVEGKSYLLGLAREAGEGDYAMVRLWPDRGPATGVSPAVTRAFNMLYTFERIGVTIDFGGSSVLFPSLLAGDVPTVSSAGTPSPEGYVEQAGDLNFVDVTLTGGAHVGHFPAGFFFTQRNTFYVTGVPFGGPVAPQIVYCHDDLPDGAFMRCEVIGEGP